jgi:hypothetical protein
VVVLHPTASGALLDELGALLGRGVVAIQGRPSDQASLEAAGAARALSLAYLGPPERPSGGAGGGGGSVAPSSSTMSSVAVQADAEALAACYGAVPVQMFLESRRLGGWVGLDDGVSGGANRQRSGDILQASALLAFRPA